MAETEEETPSRLGRFTLAKSKDDLFDTKLKERDAAVANFAGNKKNGERSYQVDAMVGYVFSGQEFSALKADGTAYETDPLVKDIGVFAQWNRLLTSEDEDDSEDTINNVTFGLQKKFAAFPVDWTQFVLGAEYLSDEQNNASLGEASADLRLSPFFGDRFGFGQTNDWGIVEARPLVRLRAEAGEIFDKGSNTSFGADDQYLRAGVIADLKLLPPEIDAIDWEKRFSLGLTYRNLWRISGDADDLERFEAKLGFELDATGHFLFNAGYRNGNEDGTLQDVEAVTVGFGARY